MQTRRSTSGEQYANMPNANMSNANLHNYVTDTNINPEHPTSKISPPTLGNPNLTKPDM